VLDAQEPIGIARADALAEIVLADHEGREIRLAELWRAGPVALVWLRHYG
jgi:hypothetical protein